MKQWDNDEVPTWRALFLHVFGRCAWRRFVTKSDGGTDRCIVCLAWRYFGKEAL